MVLGCCSYSDPHCERAGEVEVIEEVLISFLGDRIPLRQTHGSKLSTRSCPALITWLPRELQPGT